MTISLERQYIRATIKIGRDISISTPNVISFSVRKARGQASAQFSATVKMDSSALYSKTLTASSITIEAGYRSSEKLIFTGRIYKCTINPIRTDASKVLVNLSGKDNLAILEGQKINRRLKTYKDGGSPPEKWGLVNGIVRAATPSRSKFPTKVTSANVLAVVDQKFDATKAPMSFAADKLLIQQKYSVNGKVEFEIVNESTLT